MRRFKVEYTLDGEALMIGVDALDREGARRKFRQILSEKTEGWADKAQIFIVSVAEVAQG